MKFHVGDKVRVIDGEHKGNTGRVHIVDRSKEKPYLVSYQGDGSWYAEDQLERLEDASMIGKKYILEIENEVKKDGKKYCKPKKVSYWMIPSDFLLKLDIYDEEKCVSHEAAIDFLRDEGWLQEHDKEMCEDGYKHGAEEMWRIAGRLYCPVEKGGIPENDIIHSVNLPISPKIFDHTAEEVIERVHVYEEEVREQADGLADDGMIATDLIGLVNTWGIDRVRKVLGQIKE